MRPSLFILTILLFIAPHAHSAEKSINIGMSTSLSGATKALGIGIKEGAEIYINKINSNGGINGKKINLITYDDGYEPERTTANSEKLIHNDNVVALFGFMGTPTSKAATPIAAKNKIPYIAPYTGAQFLRTPPQKYIFNVRASYHDEAEKLVAHAVDKMGLKKIAILMQYDAFGKDGKDGVVTALQSRGLKPVAIGAYRRNSADVYAAFKAVSKAEPDAVILVATYKAGAEFIRKMRATELSPKYFTLSVIGLDAFFEELPQLTEEVYTSQVVPHFAQSELEIIKKYREDAEKFGNSQISYLSLEGYINAIILVEAIKNIKGEVTPTKLTESLEKLDVDVGGIKLKYSPQNHQALNQVYLTKVIDGKAVEIKD